MTSKEILHADVLDILFDNRNKQYGAYTLRKHYNKRLAIALGVSVSSVLLLFVLIPRTSLHNIEAAPEIPGVVLKVIELPPDDEKPIPPKPPKPQEQPQYRERRLTNIAIVKKDIVEPLADIRELDSSLISHMNSEGRVAPPGVSAIPPLVQTAEPKQGEDKPSRFLPVEREPQFPGGQEAWMNFLRKNLFAPAELEAGERKMVSIRFNVGADGAISDFQVMQSAGHAFDNEVIRVLKKMPKWKPAIQNGQAVSRAFTQPVTFIGMEQ